MSGDMIERDTLAEQVRRHLERQILSNKLLPGEQIMETAIAAELNISRAPVREAIRLLAAQGLVRLVARKGAVVVQFSLEELDQIYEVRVVLEQLTMRLAVPKLTPDDDLRLTALYRIMGEEVQSGNVTGYYSCNLDFHRLFLERAGNAKLEEQLVHLQTQTGRYRILSLSLPQRLHQSLEEHGRILKAALARDVEAAVEAMTAHIRSAQRALQEYFVKYNP